MNTVKDADILTIANSIVDELVKTGYSEERSKDLIHRLSKAEVLILDRIYKGDIEELVSDIITGDRVIIADGADGRIRIVVLEDYDDYVMDNLSRLHGLTGIFAPVPQDDELDDILEKFTKAPKLTEVYLYDKTVDRRGNVRKPNIPDLFFKYETIQYEDRPYTDYDIKYIHIDTKI